MCNKIWRKRCLFSQKILEIGFPWLFFKRKTSKNFFVSGRQYFGSLFRALHVIALQNIGVPRFFSLPFLLLTILSTWLCKSMIKVSSADKNFSDAKPLILLCFLSTFSIVFNFFYGVTSSQDPTTFLNI